MKYLLLFIISMTAFSADKIRIAVDDYYPFVTNENNVYRGFDIELIKMMAKDNNWEYEFVHYKNVTEIISAVEKGETDLGISGISITSEREKNIDFSMPYFDSSLGILLTNKKANISWIDRVCRASVIVGSALLQLFVICTLFSHIIWFSEAKNGDDNSFDSNYLLGIIQGYWWSIVTITTVGFGDIVPKSIRGKCIGVVVILTGLTWFTMFISSMNAAQAELSNDKITHSLKDLNGYKVAIKKGSTSQGMLQDYNKIEQVECVSIDEMFKHIEDGKVDAIFYDAPALQRYANHNDNVVMSETQIVQQRYGLVMAENSPLAEKINIFLITIKEDGRYDKLYRKWFEE